ncbi:MAG: chemotaxis protein CheX [Phycisphaerae bacterium]
MGGSTTDQSIIRHWNCVEAAVGEAFLGTCGVQVAPIDGGKQFISDCGKVIVAVINLVGDVDWAVFLGLPKETAEELSTMFTGFEIPYDSEDMGDAVGELTNILAGTLKAVLDRKGVAADISLPTVMRGQHMEFLAQSNIQSRQQLYDSPHGKFVTGVTIGSIIG